MTGNNVKPIDWSIHGAEMGTPSDQLRVGILCYANRDISDAEFNTLTFDKYCLLGDSAGHSKSEYWIKKAHTANEPYASLLLGYLFDKKSTTCCGKLKAVDFYQNAIKKTFISEVTRVDVINRINSLLSKNDNTKANLLFIG